MNKSSIEATSEKLSHIEKHPTDLSSSENSSKESESESETNGDEDDENDEEDYMINSQVDGLFCEKTFKNVQDLFKYEFEVNKFNLIEVLRKNNMGMIEYIKMINFIRQEKPSVNIFTKNYKLNEQPWMDDKFLKTAINDDLALQFDIEEDLDILEFSAEVNNNDNLNEKDSKTENDLIRLYKNKLHEAESKVEELTDIVGKLRNLASGLLLKTSDSSKDEGVVSRKTESKSLSDEDEDSHYFNSYSSYNIHLEMLQVKPGNNLNFGYNLLRKCFKKDKVRTEGYMNAILDNKNVFKDKIVLDVGCGSGILSLFAAKAGAKLVIAVDMSNIIEQAIHIARENGYENKIVFIRGKLEEVKLPVDKVDIIISEWMGYFLLFESMLDSVLYARDKYLQPLTGCIFPNYFEMNLFGVSDLEIYEKTIGYWSNVYGFKMNVMKHNVVKDTQVTTIPPECLVTGSFKFKEIDCLKCTPGEIGKFEADFTLKIERDCLLTGIGSSFDTFFNQKLMEKHSSFSTSPLHTSTHWQQTLFQFDTPFDLKKDSVLNGKITCYKNLEYQRSYIVILNVFDKIFKYKVE